MNSGEYTAYVYYDNELVAVNAFTVSDNPPDEIDILNFGVSYGDIYNGEPPLVTTAIHPRDIVTLRAPYSCPPTARSASSGTTRMAI